MTLDDGLRNIIAGGDPDDPEDVVIRALLVNTLKRGAYRLPGGRLGTADMANEMLHGAHAHATANQPHRARRLFRNPKRRQRLRTREASR